MRTKEQMFSRGELRLIGQGAEAEIFELQDGRVLKLLRARGPVERVASEVAALEAARSAGLQIPDALEQVVVDGRPGIVMERLRGTDLFSVMGRKPWLVFRAGRLTGEIHARINAARAPASLPKVKDVAQEILASLGRREPAVQLEWIGRILARLPDGEALCHGDFHPGQLMVSDGECVAFDWPAAKRGDPLFDYARTRVLLTMGEPSRYPRKKSEQERRARRRLAHRGPSASAGMGNCESRREIIREHSGRATAPAAALAKGERLALCRVKRLCTRDPSRRV
jgi:aminoglycoside phosphotransferase (APT) family kinase protein